MSRHMTTLRIALGFMSLALAGCATGGGGSSPSLGEKVGEVTVGRPMPDLMLRDMQGREVRLSDFKGKVVLVDVWATWCPPCKEEMPLLDRMADDLRADGVEVLAVSVDTELENVERFLKKRPRWALRVFHDPTGQVAERLAPTKMPTSYGVDRAGVVRFVNQGFVKADGRILRARLEDLAKGRRSMAAR